ncbi:MAG: hypothetical protein VR64_07260 [Desulfatitalea sp. BRH_c12]|nr:MAG: hypothetical protein VR64_07260 [Desulfatitalea sp. BRH_c12]
MDGFRYIVSKQIGWARNKGLDLIGSKIDRGRPLYLKTLDQNLFQPLLPEVFDSFAGGDGGELGSSYLPGKIQALHSSSALGVNVFQYWKGKSEVSTIAGACGLCRRGSGTCLDIKFEEKYPINHSLGFHPNIDIVIHNKPDSKIKVFAIESKFSEAYSTHHHGGLKSKYLENDEIWRDIPHLHSFAEGISPEDHGFMHLHPAQLVKHILGLKRKVGKNGFRLLYLWYDVLGGQGKRHRDEVAEFSEIAKQDGIKFHSLTYQELIVTLADQLGPDHHEYVRYLTARYL